MFMSGKVKMCNCALENQQLLLSTQTHKTLRGFPDRYEYLLHCEEPMCIYCFTTITFLRPSGATVSRNFSVIGYGAERF